MPLPTTDSVAFRGVPSLSAERKMALTMTLTQKQVEAIFARQSALRELNSSQYPFEIDFDDNKIYIGDIATPFTSFKEDGTREICQRSPTVSKPLAGISLSGIVIAKLNLHRDFDQDVADTVRKATEAEHSKRNERTIVRLNSPPILFNGKKSKSGSGVSTLAKKAMSNRIVSAQIASNHNRPPTSVASTSATNQRPNPPTSTTKSTAPSSRSVSLAAKSSASTTPAPPATSPKELSFTSLRARMIHYLAINTPTTQEVLLEMGGRNPSPEMTREIEDTLTAVAQEKPPPKKAPPGPVSWELQLHSWEHVQPYEWPGLTTDQRVRMARKGRLACTQMNVLSTDPLWQRFEYRVSDASVSPSSDKGKITSGQPLPKKSDFKGGMFPKEKKPSTKGGSGASAGATKTKKASSSKSKSQKDKADEVEAKVRKVVDGLTPKANGKSNGNSTSTTARVPSKKDEEELFASSSKARSSLVPTKKEDSPGPPRFRHSREEVVHKRKLMDVDTDAMSEMEEGELIIEPDTKKRKVAVTGESNKLKPKGENRASLTSKSAKETKKMLGKEDLSKLSKDVSGLPRASIDTSSLSRSTSSGSKGQRLDNEGREREEKEREKRRSTGKRARRATPSFSSDEEEEEVEERPKKAATHTRVPASAASKPKPPPRPPSSKLATKPQAVSSSHGSPSPPLPSEKEALRRRYHICYARYMGVTSKFYEQRAKVEALLAGDGESVSADEDMDMMDTEQLMQLRGEHERLRDELERILHTHANAMVF